MRKQQKEQALTENIEFTKWGLSFSNGGSKPKSALFRILMSFVFAEGESGDANGKKEKVEDVEAPAAAATGGEEAS